MKAVISYRYYPKKDYGTVLDTQVINGIKCYLIQYDGVHNHYWVNAVWVKLL